VTETYLGYAHFIIMTRKGENGRKGVVLITADMIELSTQKEKILLNGSKFKLASLVSHEVDQLKELDTLFEKTQLQELLSVIKSYHYRNHFH